MRVAVSLIGILGCFFAIWLTAQAGLARLLGRYAAFTADLAAADKAIALTPSDPEAHTTRAGVLYHLNRVSDAAREFEIAVSLRPLDDYQWLKLAMVRDELKDPAGALTAFDESVRLGPYYSLQRFQRGNFLLRRRRFDEAFADLRAAAESNPNFIPNLIDLAWGFSRGDAKATEQLAQITTKEKRIAFARLLATRGKATQAIEQLSLAGPVSDQTRSDLAHLLISANMFQEAYEIWENSPTAGARQASPVIYDGGFEGPLSLEEMNFGWRLARSPQGASLAIDSSQTHSGSKSLSIEFSGNTNPDLALVSQLIPIEPSQRYRINFSARTQDIVSGGLPFAVVSDAAGDRKRLAESPTVRENQNGWQTLSFEFRAEPTTKAVVLSVQRKNCTTSPCPIFGWIWLDSFSIETLK
ncbi:MAG: carbohydrate binding domain-containing protein [Pyrinomonadaceae bacterium]